MDGTSTPTWHKRLRFEMPAQADLYEKLKAYQWNASDAIDWSRPIRNFSEDAYAPFRDRVSREEFDHLCAERRFSMVMVLSSVRGPTARGA